MRQEQTGTMRGWGSIPFGLLLLGALAFGAPAPDTERATGPGTAPPTPSPARVRFAVIGDYGQAGPPAEAVARLVQSWNPDFVVTTGDNNYPRGEARTIDGNIGRYYHGFIAPYRGRYGPGADRNRFFPTLGNHDWATAGAQAYFDYFALPGNERYYEVRWGPVHLFFLDSDPHEPDGITADSRQAQWLRARLQASDAPWRLVILHHPPYSSGLHGSTPALQWPFAAWGATAILAGHDHVYERIERDGILYFVNGLGGHPARYPFRAPIPGSRVRYRENYGAMRVEADACRIVFRFIAIDGRWIDTVTRRHPACEARRDMRVPP
ncbi:metallophosphoesterase family protein [Thermoflexus sp.]|uniref:metallophosphoesterase family protein n=1 Tax=Thermoflexus sp. TaxID=1969742 RepID=UPI0017795C56|nr:metallophosphoesterase [Thermoflexus sp.]